MHCSTRLVIAACAVAVLYAVPARAQQRYFQIRVLDAATSAPISCAVASTLTNVSQRSDRQGNIAFHEPGLIGIPTWFWVSAPGYEHPADGFGFRGRAVTPTSG